MRQTVRILIITMMILLLFAVSDRSPVSAQAGTPSELINGVNSLRKSQGLAPYTVDNYLMGFAQSQSDYMATLGTWTHTRADGTTAFDYGIKENVAMGSNMSVQYCINTVWSDWVHWQTMTAYATGKVGAGVTVADGNVYYTLNVLPGDSAVIEADVRDENTVAAVQPQIQQATAIPIYPITTTTPNQDGIIIHTVQYGETLWTISQAYGVPIDEILRNSGLPPTTTQVFEDQELLIQTASEPTPTSRPSETPEPGTPTPTEVRPTMTPFPTRTPAPTFTPTEPPSVLHRTLGNGTIIGYGLILASGLGLVLVIYTGFLKKP